MIPGNQLSLTPQPAALLLPNPQPSLLVSRHLGGVALNDPSQGLRVKVWTCTTDGSAVRLSDGGPQVTLFRGALITEVSLAFDQNMAPVVAYIEASVAKLYWFDSQAAAQVNTTIGSGIITPRVTLDDARQLQALVSDVILAYVRAGGLYYRQQRDRYTIERLLAPLASAERLDHVGKNRVLRLQFEVIE